jgi:iron complex outermembrane receptor protein
MRPNQRPHGTLSKLALGVLFALGSLSAAGSEDDPFFDLDLKEVLNLEITSVSKKPQTVSRAAAAVFVITGEDIRRSGATSIPDALRMAPGIQVGQVSNNTWGISARGMDGRFTNKLLVLIDGRSVYTPTFSGVYWDVQDTVLADIERIEVIRGPGAALWGANAVNGVINIITKSAAATQGGMIEAAAGTTEKLSASARYGGKLGDIGHWRVYAKGFDRDGSTIEASGANGNDTWKQQRAGFRTDFAPSSRDAVTIQGDYYDGRSGESARINSLTAPYNTLIATTQKVSGGNLLGRWQRDLSATDSFTLQGYFDHTERDWPAHLSEVRNTYDVDFQYRTKRFSGHDLVIGAGYRVTNDKMEASFRGIPANTLQYATFSPSAAQRTLYSVFAQDDITLLPQTLILTLGAKLEHNDYTGYEQQPNARLLWTPSENSTFWGSVARAVRTPSRFDAGGRVNIAVHGPGTSDNPSPLPAQVLASGDIDSESVIAYELGWKQKVLPTLSFDLALFHNDYKNLRTARFGTAVCQPSGLPVSGGCFFLPGQTSILQPTTTGNQARGYSNGLELALDWRARPDLRFQLAWTELRMGMREEGSAFTTESEGSAPKHQLGVRMAWNPRTDMDVDFWFRRVDALPDRGIGVTPVPAYNEADMRLAWRPTKGVELALVGRNLLHKRHMEYTSELSDLQQMLISRSLFGQVNWRF